jgi:hypothetical protein
MTIGRRQFVSGLTMGIAGLRARATGLALQRALPGGDDNEKKAYGSGHFGRWIDDDFGLPAFQYTCDQVSDPKAVTVLNPGILGPTEHVHQVGNDRIIAVASNFGYVRVRQDEGAPKFLNDYAPEHGCFGGGIGYLTDGSVSLSTFYTGAGDPLERIFGIGYLRRKARAHGYEVDQVIFAPYGDDPVLLSQVTVTNRGLTDRALSWFEYWGCAVYEFSFRAFMETNGGKGMAETRREFGASLRHRFRALDGGIGLVEYKEFPGYSPAEEARWRQTLRYLDKHPVPDGFLAPPEKDLPRQASFDDLTPPPTFLVSLDAPADAVSSNGKSFFGSGGAAQPSGLDRGLDGDLGQSDVTSALLLERKISLKPGERRTMTFLYGYLPQGADPQPLVEKYRRGFQGAWQESSLRWKQEGTRLRIDGEPWVERETIWNSYYLRSSLTFDSFFNTHILNQGGVYQYVMGFQGAARDPLQHALPFIFSDPGIVKQVLAYTLKEVRPDGSIPYAIVGYGVPLPSVLDYSSDMPLWLLWAVSEYVLATRDLAFLDERITTAYGRQVTTEPVRDLLARCFRHQVRDVGTGEHGLVRALHEDWNDALIAWVPPQFVKEYLVQSESVLNSAMAVHVYERYAELLSYAGDEAAFATDIRARAERLRQAVRSQWTGKWFRRAWLGSGLGWLGENGLWLEPQSWALIVGAATKAQAGELVQVIDTELRQPSPIGAMVLSKSPDLFGHGMDPGISVNGGVWASLNAILIWALAGIDGGMAWDEWKKNTLACHADVYSGVWYGTWSGSDSYNSVSSDHPGETSSGGSPACTDFPVFNLHSHACSLFAITKLLGIEFTATGLALAPGIPAASYSYESPLLGCTRSAVGYSGWYDPASRDTWTIRLKLPEEAGRFQRMEINGVWSDLVSNSDGVIEIKGVGGAGTPLRWSVQRAT